MTEQTELKPVDNMTKTELRAEIEQHGETPSGSVTAIQLRERLTQLRGEEEPEEIDGVAVEEPEVEPTPEEVEREALSAVPPGGSSQELAKAEEMALELRERAVGPTQTIPALAELNAISVVAERLASSGIVPEAYRRKPDDVVAAILMGRELGIGPMQSLKDIAVIDGRPALSAHLQLAVLRRAGVQIVESEVTDDRAYIKARRPDGEVGAVEWTYAEAEKVKSKKGQVLVDKDNWRNYRQDMLWARAVGRWTRRYGSDLVAGMPYTAEEVRDFDDDSDPYGYGGKPVTRRKDVPENPPPRNEAELFQRLSVLLGTDEAREWLREAVVEWAATQNATVERWAELSMNLKNVLGQKLAGVVLDLEDRETKTSEDLRMSTEVREKTAQAFAKRLDGLALHGPPWRLSPDETSFLTRAEYVSQESADTEAASSPQAEASADEPVDDLDIPFPGGE